MTIYRIGFFTNNILATIGSVMLIQHILARFGSKMPPNTALEPTAAAPSVSDAAGNPKSGGESTPSSGGGGSALDR